MAIHLTKWQIPPTSEHDEPPMGTVNDLSPARMLGIIARPLCWRQFSITSCSRLKGQDIPAVEPGDYFLPSSSRTWSEWTRQLPEEVKDG